MVFRSGKIPGNKTNVSLKTLLRLMSDNQVIILELTSKLLSAIFEFVFYKHVLPVHWFPEGTWAKAWISNSKGGLLLLHALSRYQQLLDGCFKGKVRH